MRMHLIHFSILFLSLTESYYYSFPLLSFIQTSLRDAGMMSSSIESDRGPITIMNTLFATERGR